MRFRVHFTAHLTFDRCRLKTRGVISGNDQMSHPFGTHGNAHYRQYIETVH